VDVDLTGSLAGECDWEARDRLVEEGMDPAGAARAVRYRGARVLER
jgi:hypothetical protein